MLVVHALDAAPVAFAGFWALRMTPRHSDDGVHRSAYEEAGWRLRRRVGATPTAPELVGADVPRRPLRSGNAVEVLRNVDAVPRKEGVVDGAPEAHPRRASHSSAGSCCSGAPSPADCVAPARSPAPGTAT